MHPEPPADPTHRARLATLAALDADPDLRESYALKGGLVLRHLYGSPRPSADLDLNHVRAHPNEVTKAHKDLLRGVTARLRQGLGRTAPAYGLARAGVRITRWSVVLPTAFCEVWFETPRGEAGVLEMQVTLCEAVCSTVRARFDGVPVLAASIEDVVADKLKTILQTVPRHQVRESDVFDLWFALTGATFIPDPTVVAACLRTKVEPWPLLRPITAARFHDPAVRTFAEAGYRKLRRLYPDLDRPPFDQAWATVLRFVEGLELEG
ncbi:MAG TPA: nucleotidyl transferase AbiEii/AbiGii toxin family protein [Rhodothermales bacterium]|nr:nucleotidyl transferase AbiEii/AbiGii toxin family protein [Rhodothermales bacterium]